jgi:hypothetical protein
MCQFRDQPLSLMVAKCNNGFHRFQFQMGLFFFNFCLIILSIEEILRNSLLLQLRLMSLFFTSITTRTVIVRFNFVRKLIIYYVSNMSTSIPTATSVATSIWICLPLKISLHHHVAPEINLHARQQRCIHLQLIFRQQLVYHV